jgi:2-polyprenyl-6-hydroxyphenyl methylase/3-demethylubiquinone-9 3-methyltransferase
MVLDSSPVDHGWSEVIPHAKVFRLASLRRLLHEIVASLSRVLDLGCGHGALCDQLSQCGCSVVGLDPSLSSIAFARQRYPDLQIHQAMATPIALLQLGLVDFDIVISTEVVEHCYAPRAWALFANAALRPGGIFICSTPYHGYLKNLVLALSGKLDAHFTALWDGGHIKFRSRSTLSQLLLEVGSSDPHFCGAGRLPLLWKSMLLIARKSHSLSR